MRRRFEATPEAVREARKFFRDAVASTISEPIAEELALALSELATNAIRHAQTPFEVVVEADGYVRVEVEDGSTAPPVQRPLADQAAGGRGLLILEGLCDRWGFHLANDRKCVWCEKQLP